MIDVLMQALAQAGPWGLLAGGLVALALYLTSVDHAHRTGLNAIKERLDHLDDRDKGRVPKAERRIDVLEADFAEIKGDIRETRTDIGWIKDHLKAKERV